MGWLDALGPEVLGGLASIGRFERFAPRQAVHRRGEQTESLLVIASGRLESSITSVSGKRLIISYLGQGRTVGLVSLMDRRGAVHDLSAHDSVTVLALPREPFLGLVRKHPELAEALIVASCRRLRSVFDLLADNSLLGPRARIARLILSLHRVADPDGRGRPTLGYSQETLAEMLGMSRQRLNMEIKRLERAGLIEVAYSRIRVVDSAGLQLAALDAED